MILAQGSSKKDLVNSVFPDVGAICDDNGLQDHAVIGTGGGAAEAIRIQVSGNAGREVSGFLLSVAGMDAFGEYLCAWEDSQDGKGDQGEGDQDEVETREKGHFGPT
jgi:hypothetical protein